MATLRSAAPARRTRRGNYAILMSFLMTSLLGSGALVVDWSRARIAAAEAQAVADAAAQAGVIALRSTGSEAEAEDAARLVTSWNRISGVEPELLTFEVGGWDNDTSTFTASGQNAVRVSVGITGADAMAMPLAGLFGMEPVEISRRATAATSSLQLVLVIDVTASWDKDDFRHAKDASVSMLNLVHNAHTDDDLIGMSVFLMRYGWEFTPFTRVRDSLADPSLVYNDWSDLTIGSLAGTYSAALDANPSYHYDCYVSWTNNFNSPPGGCNPTMPRYYTDEGGTDHTTGMQMARTMFQERPDPFAYRAMVVLTDGKPTSYSSGQDTVRRSQGYNETRFRQYKHTGGHTSSGIEADTVALARDMYEDDGINIWFVSFVQYKAFMEQASQGDGYFQLASTAGEINEIFSQIGRSLPVTVVE